MLDLSIITVNWNVKEALRENLARLFSLQDGVSREVIVVDNASHDGSIAMLREHFPNILLIENTWNAGFAYAVNQGLKVAQGRNILLLNPDMCVAEGALTKTVEVLERDTRVGVVGGSLTRVDGSRAPSVRRDPAWRDQLAILLKIPHVMPSIICAYRCEAFDYRVTQSVEQVRGSYFAFRKELIDVVGAFDEGFFLWFEEVDFCKRVRRAGYRVEYHADIEAIDGVGRSFAQVSVARKQRMLSQSLLRYFRKWHPWWQTALVGVAAPVALTAGVCADVLHVHSRV
ncbi:glycosyltransferase family 2 protein [Candidatus Uhrbacteria bacterium]|nr:glycosyltransferase family 2 protein [Candidatus Uhrbacteria bacterium]